MIIDCHGHYTTTPGALAAYRSKQVAWMSDRRTPRPETPVISDQEIVESIASHQLRLMDERREDVMLISPQASGMEHHRPDRSVARDWARVSNDLVHRVAGLFPGRFAPVCQLPQTPGGSLVEPVLELRRCVAELGFVGCNRNPDPSGGFWTAPPLTSEFWFPLYEAMVELDVPAMIHVSSSDNPAVNTLGGHYLNADTTVFMQLVEGDLFARFPTLRFVMPHGGGAVPYHWGRFEGLATRLGRPPLADHLQGNVFFDTCVYHQAGFDLLTSVVPAANLLFAAEMLGAVRGTDPETGVLGRHVPLLRGGAAVRSRSAPDRRRERPDRLPRLGQRAAVTPPAARRGPFTRAWPRCCHDPAPQPDADRLPGPGQGAAMTPPQPGVDRPVVGVVGLGAMGRPIASRLARHGFTVLGLDPHTTVPDVRRVEGMSEADVVLVVVPTDEDVASVVDDLLAEPRPGQVVAICSSVRPSTCRRLAAAASELGVDVLDVALTGGVRGAANGTMNLLVGGNPAVAARIGDVLGAISGGYHVLGPVGAGQVAKAASNLIHWASIVAICESLRLAEAYGVSPTALREALRQGGTDSQTLRELELMRFTWWEKDIDVAEAMATAVGRPLPVAGLSRRLMPSVTVAAVRELLGGPREVLPEL